MLNFDSSRVTASADGSGGADEHGQHGRGESQAHAHADGCSQGRVVEGPAVPLGGEALPAGGARVAVDAGHDEEQQRRVQHGEQQDEHRARDPATLTHDAPIDVGRASRPGRPARRSPNMNTVMAPPSGWSRPAPRSARMLPSRSTFPPPSTAGTMNSPSGQHTHDDRAGHDAGQRERQRDAAASGASDGRRGRQRLRSSTAAHGRARRTRAG